MKQGRQLLTYHLGILGPDLVARLPFLNLFNGFPQLVQWIRTPRAPLTHVFFDTVFVVFVFWHEIWGFFPQRPEMPWIQGSACFLEPLLVTLDPKVFGSTIEAGGEASVWFVGMILYQFSM
jgi:hypothetical protein